VRGPFKRSFIETHLMTTVLPMHHPRSPLANPLWDAFPRSIFGESVRFDTPDGFDTRLFLTYTHSPRFICELHEYSIPMPIAPDVAGENGCWIGSGQHRA
jgi:hypothetical protein